MFVDDVVELCLVFIPLTFGLSVLTVVISAALTHAVPDEDTGKFLRHHQRLVLSVASTV